MTVQFARDDDDASVAKKGAVNEYMQQREKVMGAVLGKGNDDVITTWTALYVYGSGRSDTLKDLLLRFTGTKIGGGGTDVAGEYTWSGSVDGDTVTMTKQYVGAHSVVHQGTFNATRDNIKGTWTIPGTRAVGNFQMSEDPTRRLNGDSMVTAPLADLSLADKKRPSGALTSTSTCDTVWMVVYVYGSGRSDEIKDCSLRFVSGKITGSGEDNIGIFKWQGTLSTSGAVELTKHYAGAHSVQHTGTYDPATGVLKGSWAVPNTRAVGGFKMEEKTSARRNVDRRFTDPLGSLPDAVVITADIIYDLGGGRKDAAHGVQLRLEGSRVFSKGSDGVGEFVWSGDIKSTGVSLKKAYTGKHEVLHKGSYNPQTNIISGTWEIAGKASGSFTLEEVIAERRLALKAGAATDEKALEGSSIAAQAAFPSLERADMAQTQSLPPLTQVKAEVVTFWSGAQFIGTQRNPVDEFSMVFSGGHELTGKGTDTVGAFTVQGTFNTQTKQVDLTKVYTAHGNKNRVTFKGEYNDAVSSIRGQWEMAGMKAKGDFELLELTEKRIG